MNRSACRSTRDVMIKVPDVDRALQFYTGVLGLTLTDREPAYAGLETGAFKLYIEQGTEPGPVFEFLVPDLETARRRLLEAGCRVVEEDPKVPRIYLRDPYGLTFNL